MENNGKPQNLIEFQNSFTLFLFWSPGYARMRVFAHRCVLCMYLYQERLRLLIQLAQCSTQYFLSVIFLFYIRLCDCFFLNNF